MEYFSIWPHSFTSRNLTNVWGPWLWQNQDYHWHNMTVFVPDFTFQARKTLHSVTKLCWQAVSYCCQYDINMTSLEECRYSVKHFLFFYFCFLNWVVSVKIYFIHHRYSIWQSLQINARFEISKCFSKTMFWHAHEEFMANAPNPVNSKYCISVWLSESRDCPFSWMIWAQCWQASVLLKCPWAKHWIFTADLNAPEWNPQWKSTNALWIDSFPHSDVPLAGFCLCPASRLLMYQYLTPPDSVYFHKAWVKRNRWGPSCRWLIGQLE